MNRNSPYRSRSILPKFLRPLLLAGTSGEFHLSNIAFMGLRCIHDEPEHFKSRVALYTDMLLALWEQEFGGCPQSLLDLDRKSNVLNKEQKTLLRTLQDKLPEDILFNKERITKTAMPEAMRQRLYGDYHRLQGMFEEAAVFYEQSLKETFLPETLYRLADIRALQGERELAIGALKDYVRVRPWSVHGLLRLYDVNFRLDRPGKGPLGKGALLIYTWNHAPHLDTMFQSLSETSTKEFTPQIFALNNGSSDETARVLGKWSAFFGDRMTVISLPVNIGAPAARNWLMALPEVKACDWAMYLDDDIVLPSDWAGYFGTSMTAYPDADVYGARFVSLDHDHTLQSTDIHLFEPEVEEGANDSFGRLVISNIQAQIHDFGTFSFMRPCASVTGCVHLFRMKALQESGGFSLVFSPSQFDDFELDLRMDLKGKLPIYNGHLAIRHMQRSTNHITRTQVGVVRGHVAALESMYSPNDLTTIRTLDARIAEQDLHRKEAQLRDLLRER